MVDMYGHLQEDVSSVVLLIDAETPQDKEYV